MKKNKIVVISALLTLICSSCASNGNKTSNTFPYTTPDGSFNDSFVIDVSLKPNSILKDSVDSLTNENLQFDDLKDVFSNFTSNDLCINKTKVEYISFDKYDYGANDVDDAITYDIGNYEFNNFIEITRNNQTYNKNGLLQLVGFEIKADENNLPTKTTYNVTDGIYNGLVDFANFKIKETFDYKDETLNRTNEYYLNEYNFLLFLNMTNNEQFIKEFIMQYNEKDKANSFEFKSKKDSNKLTAQFDLFYQLNETSPIIKIGFDFIIENGVVTKTTYLYEVSTNETILEKELITFQYFAA